MHFRNEIHYNTPQDYNKRFSHYFSSIFVLDNVHLSTRPSIFNNLPHVNITNITADYVKELMAKLKNKMTTENHLAPSFMVNDYSAVFIYPLSILRNLSLRISQFSDC